MWVNLFLRECIETNIFDYMKPCDYSYTSQQQHNNNDNNNNINNNNNMNNNEGGREQEQLVAIVSLLES